MVVDRPAGRGAAVIGPSLVVEGSIKGEEDLKVEGRVVGDIDLPQHTVTVGEAGQVDATINARIIVIEGRVKGDLVAGEQVEIRRSGNVLGNITSPRVGLEDGAQFKGNIDMSPKARKDSPATSPSTPEKTGHDKAAAKDPDKKLSG